MVFVGFLIATSAWAKPSLASAPTESDPQKEAAVHFARGSRLFDNQEYNRAAEAFLRAFETSPHQAVLANIALSYDKAGKWPQAVDFYRRYLSRPVRSRKNFRMERRLRELEKLVGEISVTCSEGACGVRVDGSLRGSAPLRVVVLPGTHRVEAVEGQHVLNASEVVVQARRVVTVRLTPSPASAMDEGEPSREQRIPRAIQTAAPRHGRYGAWFWASAALAAGAAGGGTYYGVRALQAKNDYDKHASDAQLRKKEGERHVLTANVFWGVAVVAGVSALLLATLSGPEPPMTALYATDGTTLQGWHSCAYGTWELRW